MNIHTPQFRWWSLKHNADDTEIVGTRTSIEEGARADITFKDGKYRPFINYPSAFHDPNGDYEFSRAPFDNFFAALTWAEDKLTKYVESINEPVSDEE